MPRVRACSSCGASIVFLRLGGRRFLPVDAATVSEGDVLFDKKRHVDHFTTCPTADQHRRGK